MLNFNEKNKIASKFVGLTIFALINVNLADGGKLVKRDIPGDYPVLVKPNTGSWCSGIPLDSKTVLTSASCLMIAESVAIYGDNTEITDILSAPGGSTSSFIVHPKYEIDWEHSSPYDIAIIELWRPIAFNYAYNAIDKLATSSPALNQPGVDARWFYRSAQRIFLDDTLTRERIIPSKYEFQVTTMNVTACESKSELFCGVSKNPDLCIGFHGEPLWRNDQLIGIGIGSRCPQNDTIVRYVDISKIRQWIIDTHTSISRK